VRSGSLEWNTSSSKTTKESKSFYPSLLSLLLSPSTLARELTTITLTEQVTYPAELLMMPKDKDVLVTLLEDGSEEPSHGGKDLKSLP